MYDQSYQPLNLRRWGLKYSMSIPMYRQLGDPTEEYKQWMKEERLLENTLIRYENSVKMMDVKHILKNPSKYHPSSLLESKYLNGNLVLQYDLIFNSDIQMEFLHI